MDGDTEIRCPATHKVKGADKKCNSYLGKFNELGFIARCQDRRCKAFVAVNKVKGRWVFAHVTNPETIKALQELLPKKKEP
jgi:hypothetical protein